ncbi:hypothetical protein MMAG44476_00065 [Mycolicibacterium mageritense DSM 44476 = CIP 104973]|nr:hypothetical protein [Mycolicibacterium mageritense]MCC9180388.1 hypothetical protein [Mycolicibacterium mageritense]
MRQCSPAHRRRNVAWRKSAGVDPQIRPASVDARGVLDFAAGEVDLPSSPKDPVANCCIVCVQMTDQDVSAPHARKQLRKMRWVVCQPGDDQQRGTGVAVARFERAQTPRDELSFERAAKTNGQPKLVGIYEGGRDARCGEIGPHLPPHRGLPHA